MNQAHAKPLKIEIQCRTDAGFGAAQDKDVLPDIRDPLPEGTEETRPDKCSPEKIASSMNHFLFGKFLGREVIPQIDHLEAGPVQTVLVKEMGPGAVSLVIAGDALELQRTAGAGCKDHAGQPIFSHGRRDPV